MRRYVSVVSNTLCCVILVTAVANTFAQVKLEDTFKQATKPALPPVGTAEIKKPPAPPKATPPPKPASTSVPLPCEKMPAGCPTTFKPSGENLGPQWYAKQEKNFTEATKSQQKANAYLEKYKAHAIRRGWELNDVARAYAFFVSLTYNVYSKGKGPDQDQLKIITSRFRQELSKDAKFQANNDRERQLIYERLILVALDNEAGYVYAKKSSDKISQEKHRQRAKDWLEDVIEKPIDQIPSYWR